MFKALRTQIEPLGFEPAATIDSLTGLPDVVAGLSA